MKVSEVTKVADPSAFIDMQLKYYPEADVQGVQFMLRFDHKASYLPETPLTELLVVYEIRKQPRTSIAFFVTDRCVEALEKFEQGISPENIAADLQIAWVELAQGLLLEPVHIPKPWGEEIWFTGMEARGVAGVRGANGVSPLDWVLAAAPRHIMSLQDSGLQQQAPVLLKILAPLADEVYGDLYFEMHEKKQEVYVVTAIDPQAWPNGEGGIRFGFDQSLRQQYSSDEAFKQAYLNAVKDYERVRRVIDAELDVYRQEQGIAVNAPVSSQWLQKHLQKISSALQQQERELRQAMEAFIAIKLLRIGDVVKVPCFTPHSLQHGVTTVEFQTPVYERKILSFAQKVLTQQHWDTEAALDLMSVEKPLDEPLPVLASDKNITREQVVSFSDFEVERITLVGNTSLSLDAGDYYLLLVVSGTVQLGLGSQARRYQHGEAFMLPAYAQHQLKAETESCLLLAKPKLSSVTE